MVSGLGLRGRHPSNISAAAATSSISKLSSLDGDRDICNLSKIQSDPLYELLNCEEGRKNVNSYLIQVSISNNNPFLIIHYIRL